ncbi:putative mitochondrial mitochondrial carrier protein [Leptomonas pyrrhocoris]|uniref:Putative mitochondrial mitochondrial carrier protein n=1 Tax=Leptomonas pyrrhocoris TaxID=157538 RepID=A0A0M9FWS7_LEPPY|nr:putative mitochondrial mitochondrial carrier protein [Leptomonas pyrrhocoris]KPA77690.1 putative mitochondrial mitochondrial carrier protein [Leptomonas pyrrhocoris]|eukprot:XP_015656129.1 putative mitochondrial mitochondrial carrier protein [Leptomonas pyrrhocoris]
MTTAPGVPHGHASSVPTSAPTHSSFFVSVEEREWALLSLLKMSFVTFLPGAAQGASTVVLGHPLDTAKVRMQAAGPNVMSSTFGTMWSMVSTEGVRSLYRGVAPPLVMEGAKRSLQFALWDWLRAWSTTATAAAEEEHEKRKRKAKAGAKEPCAIAASSFALTTRHYSCQALAYVGGSTFLSGALAGGFGTLIGCPMHVIKIQTQYQTARDTRNAWTCMKDIYRKEGFFGYYRGFRYNVLKDVCFAGAYLGLYANLRDRACFQTESKGAFATALGAPRTSHLGAFLSGASASMATWVLLYPLDTVKTLVQSRQAHAIPAVLRHPARLYRGLAASLFKAGPVSGISMAVYEQTWTTLNKTASRGELQV